MEEPEAIMEFIRNLGEPVKKKLLNKRVLITAGPTQESIDSVRYIGNHSSGKMGFSIAETFAEMGAVVTLISGPVSLSLMHPLVEIVHVTSASEMYRETNLRIGETDVAIFSAAVADFTPAEQLSGKMKRGTEEWSIRLKPTTDIAAEMGKRKKKGQVFVGFALESDHGVEHAKRKLAAKNLDLILLNLAGEQGAGFGTDTNRVTMIDRNLNVEEYELKPKRQVAADLAERVVKMLKDA
jgi:phosphopantothenoylcysteine decarboxylase/phosphopantothenate--cysteine ligase